MGISAGGFSVAVHLAQRDSWPFFQKAIIQSGTYGEETTWEAANEKFTLIMDLSGCTTMTCLANLDADALKEIGAAFDTNVLDGPFEPFESTSRKPLPLISKRLRRWSPTIDGVYLPRSHIQLFSEGIIHPVPVIIGALRDEAALFWRLRQPTITEDEYDLKLLSAGFNDTEVAFIKQLYSPDVYDYPSDLGQHNIWYFMAMRGETDQVRSFGICSVRPAAQLLQEAGANVYVYHLEHPLQANILGAFPGSNLAAHSFEVFFTFAAFMLLVDPGDIEMADAMASYWTEFIKSGTPAIAGLPEWPLFKKQTDDILVFESTVYSDGIRTVRGIRQEVCNFWEHEYQQFANVTDA